MSGHNFSEVRKTNSGEEYRKCSRCNAVMFIEGDPYFNLWCPVANKDRENLREQLERDPVEKNW